MDVLRLIALLIMFDELLCRLLASIYSVVRFAESAAVYRSLILFSLGKIYGRPECLEYSMFWIIMGSAMYLAAATIETLLLGSHLFFCYTSFD